MTQYEDLPPELKALNGALDMVFGTLGKPIAAASYCTEESNGCKTPYCEPGNGCIYDSPRLDSATVNDVDQAKHEAMIAGAEEMRLTVLKWAMGFKEALSTQMLDSLIELMNKRFEEVRDGTTRSEQNETEAK